MKLVIWSTRVSVLVIMLNRNSELRKNPVTQLGQLLKSSSTQRSKIQFYESKYLVRQIWIITYFAEMLSHYVPLFKQKFWGSRHQMCEKILHACLPGNLQSNQSSLKLSYWPPTIYVVFYISFLFHAGKEAQLRQHVDLIVFYYYNCSISTYNF